MSETILPDSSELKLRILMTAIAMVVAIALLDWRIVRDIPLGFLYLIPMLMLGRVVRPRTILLAAAVLTVLTEAFDPFNWDVKNGIPRDVMYFVAFLAVGLYVSNAARNRRAILKHLQEIEDQSDARREAEEQLRVLIDSSPAAILTTDVGGTVLTANGSADRIFGAVPGALPGLSLQRFLPGLAHVPQPSETDNLFRAVMQCHGVRMDGEAFNAELCFSTYSTKKGYRLAVMVLDASEDLRSREETALHQVMSGSRIAVAAVSHEIRNVCGAIGVIHENLKRTGECGGSKDFEALGSLILALEQIAGVELTAYPEVTDEVDVSDVLEDLKIVIGPVLSENDIECEWSIAPCLPSVRANRIALLQILLNLTNNSVRALVESSDDRQLKIVARSGPGPVVAVEVADTGGGVAYPERLFRPFQPGAQATGLGLYLSRAFARAFGGELNHHSESGRACFRLELPASAHLERR